MTMQMTVSSKLDTNCKQRYRFADPERVKKDLENERRITRLQQVREKSSTLARHIRQEVATEQARQLRALEQVKQQELDTWREHVVAKKCQDYRTSMFQVGAAHRAAQVETENAERQKQLRAEKIQQCRQLAAKRVTQHKPANVLRSTATRGLNVAGRATAGTQTPVQVDRQRETGGKENRLCNNEACKGGKRHHSCKARHDKRRSSSNDRNERNKEEEIFQITSDSNSSDDEESQPAANDASSGSRQLQKTPPVILDVDAESEDSLEICTHNGIEINDLYMQSNRKFSRVVRPTPGETSGLQPPPASTGAAVPGRPRFTQISDLVRRTSTNLEGAQKQAAEEGEDRPKSPSRSSSRSPRKPTKEASQAGSSNASPTRTAKEPNQKSKMLPPDNPQQIPRRSSLRTNKPHVPSVKVVDAGLRRSSAPVKPASAAPVKPASAAPANAAGTENLENAQQARTNPLQQPPVQLFHMQQPPLDPMQVQQMSVHPLPPYMPPHPMYVPQMMPPYNMVPYPMPPYPTMPTMGQCPGKSQPLPTSASSASGVPSNTITNPSTSTSKGQSGAANNIGHVQFYDHNNKYRRNYKAPEQSVQVNPPDCTNMNAMENARIENQLRQLRELELNNLRQVTDERGQKALQREQVRRDCAELEQKLEALAQQQPQLLPSDANFVPSHRYADLALRREQKMNAAMEEMLLRPAIVTCPEVGVTKHVSPRKGSVRGKPSVPEAINVGDPPSKMDDAVSTASCYSILLEYVDDQSKQLRTELKGMQSSSSKSMKLRSLLQRIEKIRTQLLTELQAGDMSDNNAQKVIDSIRKERADIFTGSASNISQREMELRQKEELLEQRIRVLYKRQKQSDGQKERKKKDDSPVEIIIKVTSDGSVKQCIPKYKSLDKLQSKSDSNSKPTTSSSQPSEKSPIVTTAQVHRQNSIDSTSTSYRELPPVSYKNTNPVEAVSATLPGQPAAEPLHPMLVRYVDRLLDMSRASLDQLGVPGSEMATPTESIINNPSNLPLDTLGNDTLLDNERMERVQAFIQENRCFVSELEDTLRSQHKDQDRTGQGEQINRERNMDEDHQKWKTRLSRQQYLPQQQQSRQQQQQVQNNQIATTTTRIAEPAQRPQAAEATKSKSPTSDKCSVQQIERYAKLTENCTQRIAELTELISKVREEKQRLVEVTLTSASEGERHSTEYYDLPPLPGQQRSRSASERSDSHNTTTSQSEALPLQKNKPTGASLDSGISISRPLTALGQVDLQEPEPQSLPPSTPSSGARRCKGPPATIRRYSPQLTAEELAHELSTITEVDTPAQSHIVPAAPAAVPFPSFYQYARELHLDLANLDTNQTSRLQHEFEELIQTIKKRGRDVDYREFPSISAYLHNITATATYMDSTKDQQSLQVEEILQRLRVHNISIREFPNRRDYIQQLLEREPPEQRELIDSASLDSSDSMNVEAELRQRRILRSSFKRDTRPCEMPDLEIASSTRRDSAPPDAATYSLNESGIAPLSRSPLTIEVQVDIERMAALTLNQREQPQPAEPMNTSAGSGSSGVHQRFSGGNVEQPSFRESASDTPQDVSQMGRSLNLREFLTKELLKHRVVGRGSNSESTDESIKSNFLQSVIDSLSPSSANSPALGHATNGTNDRQKTSTPVGSFHTTQDKAGSVHSADTQLFSVESRISAVNYADGTPPVPYEQQTTSAAKSSAGRSTKTADRLSRK
ncbi:uncharacterized protein LOC108659875 [Drosophila navojoa]|uniref:uncharacterized protein LOC108659875 n=1 Tax=Drosophila navojoa TaxID=7232 RepID=UPI0011BDD04C|nr:uncharacterized protein LOC108659875 [Drosophila navojoa]